MILGHYSINDPGQVEIAGRMSREELGGNAIVYTFPSGDMHILCSPDGVFYPDGYEPVEGRFRKTPPPASREAGKKSEGVDMLRSARRARSKLQRLALSNAFRWFVTLTLDETRIDRYDSAAVQRALSAWCSNMVQRHGLRYVLVPEQHKDGAWHFHGLFAGEGLELVDSGTVKVPWAKKPRMPMNDAQREEWLAAGGHVVWNLPQWRLGFSTAIPLYGQYSCAVAYVCKYIGKQDGQRPLGRWYYSGGDLRQPEKMVGTLDYRELKEQFPKDCVEFSVPGRTLLVIHTRLDDEGGFVDENG